MKRGIDGTIGERIYLIIGSFILVLFAAVCVYPILLVIGSSFTEELTLIRNGYQIIPAKFSLFAYQIILGGNSAMLQAYVISVIVTVVGTAAAVTVGVMIAYAISRRDFRLRRFFNLFVVFTLLFNAGLVPWYIVNVTVWHLKNTLAALILPNMVNSFNILLLCNFMRTVPKEIIESARIDGASEFRIASAIVVPIAMPGYCNCGFVFRGMNYWNDWWLALLYIDNAPQLFPIQLLLRTIVTYGSLWRRTVPLWELWEVTVCRRRG